MATTDQLTNKLLEIITQIQQGVIAHGADATALALQAVSYDGICNLMWGISSLIAMIACIYGIYRIFNPKQKSPTNSTNEHTMGGVRYSPCRNDNEEDLVNYFLFFITCSITFFVFACWMLDFWTWVQIFNPKVYLAHEIIQKVMQ